MMRTTSLIVLLLSHTALTAQVVKYSNDFLNIGVGARWMSMGSTGVALSSGMEAAYWNPSGLTAMDRSYEVGAMHASYFAGLAAYNHMALSHRLDTASAHSPPFALGLMISPTQLT